jgi:ABC-type antimicrobial peptide transport system permease subunit
MQLTEVDPDQQSASTTEDLDTWITNQQEWQQEHLVAWIFGAFAGLGLALASVGIYSVVSYIVVQRTNEFGIRMALGAPIADVLRIVFTSILGSVLIGIGVGLVVSRGLTAILAQWAKGNSGDLLMLLMGALLLILASVVACAIPALRASRIDPMMALRCE